MKTRNIFSSMLVCTMVAALALVSCAKEENGENGDEKPSFPALVENYNVQPGSELTLTFTPNYDWKISIPSEIG